MILKNNLKIFQKKNIEYIYVKWKKKFEKKIKNYIFKMINIKNKIENMCNNILKIFI